MAISMVRKPSETANINNIDDIIPFRYAYGNQNGYVISRGSEVSHTASGNQFTVNSGRIVIDGVESDIDSNGVTLTVDAVSETRYYVVFYEVNLATNTASVKLSGYSTSGYPTIEKGDDLTANSNGTARLALYRFNSTNGVISGVEKVVNPIDYTGSALVGYDSSKGTVEERLNRLGFKQGTINLNSSQLKIINTETFKTDLKRQGNYVIGYIYEDADYEQNYITFPSSTSEFVIGTLSEEFRPKENQLSICRLYYDFNSFNSTPIIVQVDITTSGEIKLKGFDGDFDYNFMLGSSWFLNKNFRITFGYEANPIGD